MCYDGFVPSYSMLPGLGLDTDGAALDKVEHVVALDRSAIDLLARLMKRSVFGVQLCDK